LAKQISFVALVLLYLSFAVFAPLLAQEAIPSETPFELSPTWTESSTPIPTATINLEASQTSSPQMLVNSALPEVSAEASEASPELTAVLVEAELTIEATEAVFETIIPSFTPTSTSTPNPTASPMPDRILRGRVTYQVGQNHAGILITAHNADGWQTSTHSDELGIYSLDIYSASAYTLEFSAPLYLSQQIWLVPGDSPAAVILLGGNINSDTCINQLDLDLLKLHYELDSSTDIDRDGHTDASDLAILTGNYDASCGLSPEVTETASAILGSEATAEVTASVQQPP
jgi:hypothetical protein